jgi:hypothetical protein
MVPFIGAIVVNEKAKFKPFHCDSSQWTFCETALCDRQNILHLRQRLDHVGRWL